MVNFILTNKWIELSARWILGMVFIYASYSKIVNPGQFAKIVYGYGLFPEITINLIAIVIPWLELVAAAALIAGIYPRSAVLVINGMLFSYIIIITVNLIRGHQFDCGCFSMGNENHYSSAKQLLVRDIIYFAMGSFILWYGAKRKWCLLDTGGLLARKKSV